MRSIYRFVLVVLIGWVAGQTTQAQTTSFTALWSFNSENLTGSSNNAGVVANTMTDNNVTVSTIATIAFVAGQVGEAVNVQNWSTSGCDDSEYVTFTIMPNTGSKVTVTQFSLFFNQSPAGPTLIKIRSSADNFSSDLYSQAPTSSFQAAVVSVSNVVDQTTSITFRIYACSSTATGGALRLDEVTINGTVTTVPLPVTLLSFTAKPEGDRVPLAWATTSERDADRFVVERSTDLREYVSVGEVAAKGTTDTRQYYGLTDTNPLPGANYYRLRQIDRDGTAQTFKPVSAVIGIDDVVAVVYPNPADPARIHLRLWNADGAAVRLLTLAGQPIGNRLERRLGDADLIPQCPLAAGLYLVEVRTVSGQKLVSRVLVR